MDLGGIPILSIVIFLPLVGALMIAFAPPSPARGTAPVFSRLAFVASLLLVRA